jgi:hypothetical protein
MIHGPGCMSSPAQEMGMIRKATYRPLAIQKDLLSFSLLLHLLWCWDPISCFRDTETAPRRLGFAFLMTWRIRNEYFNLRSCYGLDIKYPHKSLTCGRFNPFNAMFRGGTFGKWLDHDPVNGLMHWWIHSWMHYWEVAETEWWPLLGRSRSLGECLWSVYLVPWPFFSLSVFLAIMRWAALLHYVISADGRACLRFTTMAPKQA